MKISSRWYIYGTLVIAVVIVAAIAMLAPFMTSTPDVLLAQRATREPPKVDGIPLPDVLQLEPSDNPQVLSAWLAARTKRYRALFADWQCDVLLLPVQVESAAFDVPTRQLIAGDIALHLRKPDVCVTDPYLVDLALGEGMRRYPTDSIKALAQQLKAKTIISTFVGHVRYDKLRLTMIVEQLNASGSEAKSAMRHSLENLKYGGKIAPFEVVHDNLPELLSAVGLDGKAPDPRPAGALPSALPSSPEEFLRSDSSSPITQSAEFVLLGILAPSYDSRARERLFTKAWHALAGVNESDPTARRMRARILFHLFERPFALAQIEGMNDAEANGLRGVLNGNLPDAQDALSNISEPWEKSFLTIEVHDLAIIYQHKDDLLGNEFIAELGTSWKALTTSRVGDDDGWAVADVFALKTALERLFPIPGQTLNETLRGNAVIGQADDASVYDLMALKHVHQLLQEHQHNFCCNSFITVPTHFDVLDLFDSRAEMGLINHISHLQNLQGLAAKALQKLEGYDSELAGNPWTEAMRAQIDLSLVRNGSAAGNSDLSSQALAAGRIAAITGQGQYPAVENGMWVLSRTGLNTFALRLGDAYGEDYPIRPFWPAPTNRIRDSVEFSSNDARPLKDLAAYSDQKNQAELQNVLSNRFIGSPIASELKLHPVDNETPDPSKFQRAIAQDPDNWELYVSLADYYIDRNQYSDASRSALSFPGFKNLSSDDSLALSNKAFEIGEKLYFLGADAAARPLLQIAADQSNGSTATLRSQAQLAVLNGRYAEAALTYREIANHYTSLSDYRDYLSLLFASGDSHDGWAGFNTLVRHNSGSQPWLSAMVGHRRDDISAHALRKWLTDNTKDSLPPKDHDALVNYAMMEQITDRNVPPDDFTDFITALAGPSRVKPKFGFSFEGAFGNAPVHRLGPSEFTLQWPDPSDSQNKGNTPFKPRKVPDEFVVPNRYSLYAKAYLALRKGEFEASANAFNDLASFYEIETMDEWGFALPYFALASAQSNDKLHLERYLDNAVPKPEEWGVYLAKAVFKGVHGQHDDSLKWLDKAFHSRPPTGYWPLTTAYEYAEICTSLFDITHEDRYRQKALDWAQARRKIDPTDAWAHALVARLSTNESERIEALAMSQYLDPQSAWAQQVPANLHTRASVWLKQHPPFQIQMRDQSARSL